MKRILPTNGISKKLNTSNLLFCSLLFSLFALPTFAQFNQWVWVKGDTTAQPPVFGTQGTAAANNHPGGRYEPAEWVDKQGNLWMFGGTLSGFMDDLWKYDPITDMWTWVKGSNTMNTPPVYGTKNVPSSGNTPGARGWGSASWTDTVGDLWLFGGYCNAGKLNDLWRYNIAANQWTWMHGSNIPGANGIYGTKGNASASTTPGARNETSCTWVDNNDNLWLFGGEATFGNLNDLWKYNIGTNQWTWMSGSNNLNQSGVYGSKGVAAATNHPGARSIYSSWKDADGNLWLFGGITNSFDKFNDLWKYDIAADMWTWESGSNTIDEIGTYGSTCTPSLLNEPGARFENRTNWTDDCSNFWMFGGFSQGGLSYNDLWRYNPIKNEWVWIKGDSSPNQKDVYGTMGTFSTANKPGTKYGAISWTTKDGFWLHGGISFSPKNGNVLWKYIADTITAGFTFSSDTGCAPSNISFVNTSNANCNEIKSYDWNFDDPSSGSDSTSTLSSPTHTFSTSGDYNVKLTVTSCTGEKDSVTHLIHILPPPIISLPAGVTVFIGTSATLTASGGAAYSWYPSNGLSCTNCANPVATPTTTTTYFVKVTDDNGCEGIDSVIVTVELTCGDIFVPNAFSPNNDGENDVLYVRSKCIKSMTFSVFDRWGEKVFETNDLSSGWDGKYKKELLSAGIFVYTLTVVLTNGSETRQKGNINLIK